MEYEFEFDLTKEDYRNFYFYGAFHSPEKKKAWRKYYITSSLFFCITIAVVYFFILDEKSKLFIPLLVGGIVYWTMITFASKNKQINYLQKIINDPLNQNIFSSKKLMMTDIEISSKDAQSEGIYKWSAITKIEEDKNNVYLFPNNLQAIILPKRCFKNEAQQNDFILFAQSKMAS